MAKHITLDGCISTCRIQLKLRESLCALYLCAESEIRFIFFSTETQSTQRFTEKNASFKMEGGEISENIPRDGNISLKA